MQDLIGKRFKRNKYGLSVWEDTIQDFIIKAQIVSAKDRLLVPIIMIKGTNHWYPLNEIVIIW